MRAFIILIALLAPAAANADRLNCWTNEWVGSTSCTRWDQNGEPSIINGNINGGGTGGSSWTEWKGTDAKSWNCYTSSLGSTSCSSIN